jgi:hypothetical protein
MKDREQECSGLSTARHRAREQIVPLERWRDRLVLDRGGTSESELADPLQQIRMQA